MLDINSRFLTVVQRGGIAKASEVVGKIHSDPFALIDFRFSRHWNRRTIRRDFPTTTSFRLALRACAIDLTRVLRGNRFYRRPTFPTNRGTCFRSKAKPNGMKTLDSCTVGAQSKLRPKLGKLLIKL